MRPIVRLNEQVARDEELLNVAFLLDPMVHPDLRRAGLGSSLVRRAPELARDRGATWLHVDYEPHLAGFYERCGFRPTQAGLIRL